MAGEKNWSAFKVPELKGELSARGLSTTGNKADLVSRLQADDRKKAEEAAAAAAPPPSAPAADAVASGMNIITSAATPSPRKIWTPNNRIRHASPSASHPPSSTAMAAVTAAAEVAVQVTEAPVSAPDPQKQSSVSSIRAPTNSSAPIRPSPLRMQQSVSWPDEQSHFNAVVAESSGILEKPSSSDLTGSDDKPVASTAPTTNTAAPTTTSNTSPSVASTSVSSLPVPTLPPYKSALTLKSSTTIPAEDEIDWEDDDTKLVEKPTEAAIPEPVQPAKPEEPAVPETTPAAVKEPAAVAETADPAADGKTKEDEAPKEIFAAGLAATSVDEEARKRADRAKRFGLDPESEEVKKAKRAEKFGLDSTQLAKGLDAPLPERGPKRGRGQGGEDNRPAKRATPDRRGPGGGRGGGGHFGRGRGRNAGSAGGDRRGPRDGGNRRDGGGRRRGGGGGENAILADPTEKAKAEARAKRFAA